MSHTAVVSQASPGCIIFLLNHSRSMTEDLTASGRLKRDVIARVINCFLTQLIIRCEKDEGVRHWFDVGVIGYKNDGNGTPVIGPALKGTLAGVDLVSTVELSEHPFRLEEKIKIVDDREGGRVAVPVKFLVWYEAPQDMVTASSPMCAALEYVTRIAQDWSYTHPASFPPVVIHITDGGSSDGNPELMSAALRSIRTQEGGEAILFNCHLSNFPHAGVLFPVGEADLPDDELARVLFRMSSVLPDPMRRLAESYRIECGAGARDDV